MLTLPDRPPTQTQAAAHGASSAPVALFDAAVWKNRLQPYDILSPGDVEAIHGQAMTILEEIGIDFLHPRARDTFKQAGMPVEDMRVRFDRAFVMEMVAKAPPVFNLQARNPDRSVTIGGDNVVTAPVYGPPFITD